MGPGTLAIIHIDQALTESPVIQGVLQQWADHDSPTVGYLTIDQVLLDQSLLDSCSVAWVLTNNLDDERVLELLATLHDRQLPTAISASDCTAGPGEIIEESAVAVPLQAAAAVIQSILRTLFANSLHVYSLKTEIKLLQLRQGGLANQIQQLDEEMRLAALLQREFVPDELPAVHGIHFHAMFRPAGYVSGDIYDVIRLDEDHVGMFIADAVGHGVPAALMTIVIKRALVTTVPDPDAPGGIRIIPPHEALSRLNNEMSKQVSSRRGFPSACYCVMNCRTLEVSLARAGHPFPMVLKANGDHEWIKPQGTLLGIFPDGKYEQVNWTLSPGDRLVIYSDGFEQAFPSDQQAGAELSPTGNFNYGYATEFLDLANGPMDQAFQRLSDRLDEQAGSLNQDDDLTVVCASVDRDRKPVDAVPVETSSDDLVTPGTP